MTWDVNRRLVALVLAIGVVQTGLTLTALVWFSRGPFGESESLSPASAAPSAVGASGWGTVLGAAAVVISIAAWAAVLWVMVRMFARQRELVRVQRRFVADISHELKTPLALVRMLAETLRDGRVRDPKRVHEYHVSITRESERLSGLLENILDYSSIESGQKRYEFSECDVAQVARQTWTLFEPQFELAGFDAELEIAADLPTLRGDSQALGQLIINLLQNALRYSAETKFVRLTIGREPGNIVLTVEDHGIGMSRGQVQRIGDSFYRAPDPRVRKTRGTGLGHAIIKHIIAAHGGKLGVYSHPSLGSTFVVRLPLPAAESQPPRT